MLNRIVYFFGAGSLAAAVTAALAQFLGSQGLLAALGSQLHPGLSLALLYERIAWGGLWAQVGNFPGFSRLNWIQRSLLASLFPSAAELLYWFPKAGLGWFGANLGWTTALIVAGLGFLWALMAFGLAARARV